LTGRQCILRLYPQDTICSNHGGVVPRENKTRYAVLGLLAYMPLSGYDIKTIYQRSLGNFWGESFGHIYPTLGRLVEEGLATCDESPSGGRPGRKVYTITEEGRAEARRWLEQPAEPHQERMETLLKVYLGWEIGSEGATEHVRRFRREHEAHLARYAVYAERIAAEQAPGSPYWLLTVLCGQHMSKAMLDWCDEALKILGELPLEPRAREDDLRSLEELTACSDDADSVESSSTGRSRPEG
jgi:PadR family transcriptional regulator AphA